MGQAEERIHDFDENLIQNHIEYMNEENAELKSKVSHETEVSPHFFIVGEWEESLIWCPSQCYLNIKYKNKKYIIYLRWRWRDPWNAELVPSANNNYEFDYKTDWVQLFNDGEFFKDKELAECKAKVIENAINYFQSAG